MGQLLQLLLDNLYKLWPLRIIDEDQQGLRFRADGSISLLLPGRHWFVPGLQRIEQVQVAYQQVECGVQNMETKDGVGVSFSFNVGFTIADAATQRVKFFDFDDTLRLIVRGKLGEIVHAHTYEELQTLLPEISKKILSALRQEVSGSGVRIKDVRPDEFGKSRLYRVIGGGPLAF
jgi:regulator of protease activity HflC (stomatin/prohibitin superfamily)